MSWGWNSHNGMSSLIKKKTPGSLLWPLSQPSENTRRWPSASPKTAYTRSHIGLYLDHGFPGLLNCVKMNFCYLSHLIYDILLWQPDLPKTRALSFYSLLTVWKLRSSRLERRVLKLAFLTCICILSLPLVSPSLFSFIWGGFFQQALTFHCTL